MRLKSYFVHTMEEALQAAKVELGEDAMLVDSKQLDGPPGSRVRLEVIFAAAAVVPPPKVVDPAPNGAGTVAGLQQFRGELRNLLDALSRKPDVSRLEALTPARAQMEALRAKLLLSEVPFGVADDFVQRCRPVFEGLVLRSELDPRHAEAAVTPILGAEWPTCPEQATEARQVLAFVGPTGCGKTSAIAKLAFRMGVSQSRPVTVLSIDNLRIGASDQLAHLCSLLGVPFHSLDHSGALGPAMDGTLQRGLVLIDTPGYGPADRDMIGETASQLRRIDSLECHLVLPASLRHTEMRNRHRHFAAFAPAHLLFTRLDETEYFGPAWAFAHESGLPVRWVSTGPGIPEDLEDADAAKLAEAVLGNRSFGRYSRPQQPATLANAATAGTSRI